MRYDNLTRAYQNLQDNLGAFQQLQMWSEQEERVGKCDEPHSKSTD